ncbi:TPA: hypothetical protein DEG21_06095 [Patescibacteria group bacterium]|nr:hypothetical protein [Candidatus Gracilibacteria bacterium]HBY75378.1 hypothetical protein [Candidatus Gracilibacteria bacterium]
MFLSPPELTFHIKYTNTVNIENIKAMASKCLIFHPQIKNKITAIGTTISIVQKSGCNHKSKTTIPTIAING